jgi:hypothetical protein
MRSHMRLYTGMVGNIYAHGEQVGDELCQADIFENPDRRVGLQIEQNVDVA